MTTRHVTTKIKGTQLKNKQNTKKAEELNEAIRCKHKIKIKHHMKIAC